MTPTAPVKLLTWKTIRISHARVQFLADSDADMTRSSNQQYAHDVYPLINARRPRSPRRANRRNLLVYTRAMTGRFRYDNYYVRTP